MYAKKSLGQHFLTSNKAVSQIVAAGNLIASDTVLEIGPGQGVLTRALLATGATVIAIEKDRDLIPVLSEVFAEEIVNKKLILLHEDVLLFDADAFFQNNSYKIIANIPYYITGAIIEKFLSTKSQPNTMVLLIQKEVAERIIARDKKESILSVAVKVYGVPTIVAKVPAGAFNPPPKVDSSIIAINNISRKFFDGINGADESLFFQILKKVFGQKRKQIGNTLGEFLDDKLAAEKILTTSAIPPSTRPEDMLLENWKVLTQVVAQTHRGIVQ